MTSRIFSVICALFVLIAPTVTNAKKGYSESRTKATSSWQNNYENALAAAKAQNRHVLMYFTGSDWCGPCKLLKEEVYSTTTFKDYAKQNLILLEIDFPAQKKQSKALVDQNNKLAEDFGILGFPTIFVLDPNGKQVGKTGFVSGGADAFISKIESFM